MNFTPLLALIEQADNRMISKQPGSHPKVCLCVPDRLGMVTRRYCICQLRLLDLRVHHAGH